MNSFLLLIVIFAVVNQSNSQFFNAWSNPYRNALFGHSLSHPLVLIVHHNNNYQPQPPHSSYYSNGMQQNRPVVQQPPPTTITDDNEEPVAKPVETPALRPIITHHYVHHIHKKPISTLPQPRPTPTQPVVIKTVHVIDVIKEETPDEQFRDPTLAIIQELDKSDQRERTRKILESVAKSNVNQTVLIESSN